MPVLVTPFNKCQKELEMAKRAELGEGATKRALSRQIKALEADFRSEVEQIDQRLRGWSTL